MRNLLRKLGLNMYEIKAYTALLNSEPVTAYKLGKLSGVPSGRIYDIAEKLMLKGLIALEPGKPKRYKAVGPEKAINSLLNKKDKNWQKTKSKIKDLIPKLKKKKVKEDPISIVKERDIYYQKIIENYERAEKEIDQIVGGLTGEKRGHKLTRAAKKAIKRGVKVKMIAPINKENKKTARKIQNLGVKIRNYPISGLRLNLVDEKTVIISIVDKALSYNRATISIESESFCKGIKEWFEVLWKNAGRK